MGLDTSAHPVDEALFRDRLVPFVRAGKPIDDLIARAARMAVASSRATTWRFSAQNFSWKVREAQEAVVPTVTERYSEPARKQNFLESVLGIKPPTREKTFTRPERVPGLAAVDNDLTSFGRPFFMPVEGTERVLALYERYMQAEKGGEAAVDAIAREMVRELSANALNFPVGTRPAVIEATKRMLPFEARIVPERPDEDGPALSVAQHEKRLKRESEMWRFVFLNRKSDKPLPSEFRNPDDDRADEPLPAREYVRNLPLQMAGFAAELMPGWMSRGYGFASSLFDTIGVKASHVFETPEVLFKDLVKDAPEMRGALNTTIVENFILGGYVPAAKMKTFVDLLAKHERAMVLAFHKGPAPTPEQIKFLAEDYIKILEPATYALKNGFGYLEAAEIYSGPLGWAN
jgi:hypothetical protein